MHGLHEAQRRYDNLTPEDICPEEETEQERKEREYWEEIEAERKYDKWYNTSLEE